MRDPKFLTRIAIQDYRSIGACDVSPEQFTILVGPNGAGKSNFLDALRLVADSVRITLGQALYIRGGLAEVARRKDHGPKRFAIRLDFELEDSSASLAFAVERGENDAFRVRREDCLVKPRDGSRSANFYSVRSGQVAHASIPYPPVAAPDNLYLVRASSTEEFRPVFDALSEVGIYNLNPAAIRALQSPDPGGLLRGDGGNAATLLQRLEASPDGHKWRIEAYLSHVVPGLVGIAHRSIGPMHTIEFLQRVAGTGEPQSFLAANMSDGAVRALGLLIALFQDAGKESLRPRLIGIEEPEVTIHPSISEVLVDCLMEAACSSQVMVTSHQHELLNATDIPHESILVAEADGGETRIGPLGAADRSILGRGDYTAGDLLRIDQLRPQPVEPEQHPPRPDLFDFMPGAREPSLPQLKAGSKSPRSRALSEDRC